MSSSSSSSIDDGSNGIYIEQYSLCLRLHAIFASFSNTHNSLASVVCACMSNSVNHSVCAWSQLDVRCLFRNAQVLNECVWNMQRCVWLHTISSAQTIWDCCCYCRYSVWPLIVLCWAERVYCCCCCHVYGMRNAIFSVIY